MVLTWQKETNREKAIKLILFLISPFVAFLYSLRSIKTRSSYNIFFLTAIFFGMSFTVNNVMINKKSFDGVGYRIDFENAKHTTPLEYYNGLQDFLKLNEGKKDYYFDTLSFFLSRITDNYHVLFMIAALVFVFFSMKSFKFFIKENKFDTSVASYILAYLFMIIQIFEINGLRFYTAAWIAIYALFQIFGRGEKRYFLLILITPFFHGSYWIFIAVVVVAYLLMRFEKVWIVAFVASFFAGNIAVEILQNVSDKLPVFVQRMIEGYTDKYYLEQFYAVGTGFSWVPKLFSIMVRIYINLMVYLFIKNSAVIKGNLKTKKLYLFILVYMTFVNLTMSVPSLGERYINLAYPIIAYIWLINFKGVKYERFLYAMPVIYSFAIYNKIFTHYLQVLELDFFIGSPLWLIYRYLIAF